MKAYIGINTRQGRGYVAEVVTEQDWSDGGPHAHSYRTPLCESASTAKELAVAWTARNGYTVTDVDSVAA